MRIIVSVAGALLVITCLVLCVMFIQMEGKPRRFAPERINLNLKLRVLARAVQELASLWTTGNDADAVTKESSPSEIAKVYDLASHKLPGRVPFDESLVKLVVQSHLHDIRGSFTDGNCEVHGCQVACRDAVVRAIFTVVAQENGRGVSALNFSERAHHVSAR